MADESGWSLLPDEAPRSSSQSRPRSDITSQPGTGTDLIVLVEDNVADVELVRLALRTSSIDRGLRVFSDGDQAIRFVDEIDNGQEACPALFILDLNLPRRPGRDVLRRIRASAVCRTAPVVVFSSSAAEEDRNDSVQLGANRYMVKPADLEEFLKIGEAIKPLIEGR